MAESQQFSDDVLNETPERVVKFVGYIGRTPTVRVVMEQNGYSQKEHDLGWRLLMDASNYHPASPVVAVEPKAAEALAYVDGWEEPNIRRFRSALERLHPAQGTFLFGDIEFATGAQSLVNVALVLDRVDQLEGGKAEDKAAVATLDGRGLTQAVRKELREKIAAAKGLAPAPGPVASGSDKEAHRAALVALKLWYDDWAETARTCIRRRDVLIRLGLAERKDRKKDESQN